jgi:glycosyltransferase involved in cell wall biosynthesis
MKRILIISREYPPSLGGAGIAMHNYIKEIKSYKFTVLSFFNPVFSNKYIKIKELKNPFWGHRYIGAILFIFSSLFDSLRHFECIVGNAFVGAATGTIIKILTGKKLISIIHDVDYLYSPLCKYNFLNKFVRKVIFKLIFSLSDVVIVPNAIIKREIIKIFGRDIGKKIHVITLGVDIEPFKKIRKLRRKTLILCVAAVRKNKGIEYLIEGFKKVVNKFPESELWIAGTIMERDYYLTLGKLIRDLKIEDKVKFLGPIVHFGKKNVFSYYDICDIFAITSYHSERFGIPCVEASLMGKPIVATDIFEENGVIVNGKTALVVPKRNSEAVGNAIIRLLKNRKLGEKLGKGAKEYAERFKTSHLAKEFESIIEKTINSKD